MSARNFERSSFKLKRDNERAYRYQAASARENAKKAMTRYAEANGISCFVCKKPGEVAKMDTNKRGTWMLCVPCAEKRRRERQKHRNASG